MRLEDNLDKITVFIGIENHGVFTPLGSAFLVGVNQSSVGCFYLVTANHVVDSISGDTIAVRMNRKAGGCVTMQHPKWLRHVHSDPATDIAVFPFGLQGDVLDHIGLDISSEWRDQQRREKWRPEVGDEVVAIGLYTSHYGQMRNVPVARIGHVSAMPGEPVRTGFGYAEAYLVEMRSIAGLSGSPVFVSAPEIRHENGQPQFRKTPMNVLIGVLVGYHLVETKEDQIVVPKFQSGAAVSAGTDAPDELHTGFTVVIPIERVAEILDSKPLGDLRAALAERVLAQGYKPAGP